MTGLFAKQSNPTIMIIAVKRPFWPDIRLNQNAGNAMICKGFSVGNKRRASNRYAAAEINRYARNATLYGSNANMQDK